MSWTLSTLLAILTITGALVWMWLIGLGAAFLCAYPELNRGETVEYSFFGINLKFEPFQNNHHVEKLDSKQD